jgi:large subunit ribosomal protein L32
MRRSQHDRMAAPAVSQCRQCGAPIMPHRACQACGTYRGRQVIEVETEPTEKKEA